MLICSGSLPVLIAATPSPTVEWQIPRPLWNNGPGALADSTLHGCKPHEVCPVFSRPWPEDVAPREVVDNITEEFCVGEQLGFDSGWLAEHHFSRYGLGSASLMLLANIAARTTKLRLGTAVIIPPLSTDFF